MNVLVTGAGGMLGTDLCADLSARGHVVVATDVREPFVPLDITDTKAVRAAFAQHRPDAVIHCAAWTDVDGAEKNPDGAYKVNALGSWNVATVCAETNVWMAHVSTDFVFDGEKGAPYTEFDATNPLGHYGASKEAAERLVRQTLPARHVIARTAWLYGVQGKNLPYVILNAAKTRPELSFVSDQIVCPTHTKDLSRKLIDLIEDPLPGTYHVCSAGSCSLYEFAQAVVAGAGLTTPVVPTTLAEFEEKYHPPTRRPRATPLRRLALEMRGMDDLPTWDDALRQFLALVPPEKK